MACRLYRRARVVGFVVKSSVLNVDADAARLVKRSVGNKLL